MRFLTDPKTVTGVSQTHFAPGSLAARGRGAEEGQTRRKEMELSLQILRSEVDFPVRGESYIMPLPA